MSAPMRLLRMTVRRVKPDSSSAWRKTSTAPASSPRCEPIGWRMSTNSTVVMSDLPQWTAPKPMPSRARVAPRPMNMLFRRTSPTSFDSIGNSMYAAIAQTLPRIER